jgi:hypothetical protein
MLPTIDSADTAGWRNRIAHAIFQYEMGLAADEVPPWAEVGIPIAVAAFGAAPEEDAMARWMPLFLDRFSVVRAGGRPRPRSALVPGAGNKFLWQARIEQLAEHIADLGRTAEDIADIAGEFRYLPPVGLLPKQAVDPRTRVSRFFPSSYVIEALPIPIEQLDTAVKTSASLRAFDLATADRVHVLVPVPQVFYEPRLLQVEEIDPSFQTALDEFVATRAVALQRRENVRAKASAVVKALTGEAPQYPPLAEDPDALEANEEVGTGTLDPDEDAFGTEARGAAVVATAFEDFVADLRASAPWSTAEVSTSLEALPTGLTIPGSIPDPFKLRIRYDATRKLLFLRGNTTGEQREQLQAIPAGDAEWEKAILRLHEQANADVTALHTKGLEGFVPYLEGKIRRADDHVDFGFLRVQTDIYRLRHVMLGATEATRLATSPVLASIAKGETAIATREDITKFFEATRGKPVTPPEGSGETDAAYISYIRNLGKAAPAPAGPEPSGPRPEGGVTRMAAPSGPQRTLTLGARTIGGLTGESGISKILTPKIESNLGGIQIVTEKATSGILTDAGIAIAPAATQVDLIQQQGALLPIAGIGAAAVQLATRADITQDAAIVGETYDFRTATVAKRMESPPALEASSFSVAGKFEVVSNLAGLDIAVSDLPVKGLGGAATFADVHGDTLADILQGTFDPRPDNGDEADFFGRGVRALDDTVVTLRTVEGRIQQYRVALEKCKKAIAALRAQSTQIDRRLKQLADDLAEARHDVSVARALLAEEIARVAAVNARRDEIVANHVGFLAYVRPRLVEAHVAAPTRVIDPGLVEAPVPVCLASEIAVPAELRAMVDLMREVPVRWYTHLPRLLERFDRLDLLHGAVLTAKTRASFKVPGEAAAVTGIRAGGTLGQGVFKAFSAQQQTLSVVRARTAQLDVSVLAGLGWQQSRLQAEELLSLGDLLDAGHGRTDVAQAAAREIEQIARVAACLYAACGGVLPRIRLEWAERLSQYDDPITLRNLASLPRWGEIELLDRREMQGLVDWLYSRVDAARPDAIGLMSDIVRVCILLASHAPVSQIVAGHVPKPTTVVPGKRIDVKVDLSKVRIGMHVLMYDQQTVVARGVVQDLASGLAAAQVMEIFRPSVTLETGARVQFTAGPGLVPGS